MTTAWVLAGHGSHISPETAGLVWSHVDALRAMNIADEITAAFWKEMPSFHTVFDSLDSNDITVIPLFTAQGYFTQTVIPAEMGLTGAITRRNGKTIRYARTLSEHPYLSQVVRQRVEEAIQSLDTTPDQTAVALIGHSTKRNPESRKATEDQAEAVRHMGLAHEVVALYLDDTPAIADVYELTSAPNLIVVPYFLANGSHTTIDVPRELGLDESRRTEGLTINGRRVYYTQPVGVEDDLRQAIIELAYEAGASLKSPRMGSNWDCFPAAYNRSLSLLNRDEMIIGQLRVTRHEITHVDDDAPTLTITDPADLRRKVRENPFRALATSSDLPRGWRVPVSNFMYAHAVVETIYPGVMANLVEYLNKGREARGFEATISRQTGRYKQLEQLSTQQKEDVVHHVCGNCVRQPMWTNIETELRSLLLCPEPCDFWLSTALKSMKDVVEA